MRVEFLNFNVALKYRDGQQLRQLCRCYLVINTTIVKLLHSSVKFTSKMNTWDEREVTIKPIDEMVHYLKLNRKDVYMNSWL